MANHEPVFCDIDRCRREAMRWFDPRALWGSEFPLHTFYVCDEHRAVLSPNDDFVAWLNPFSRVVASTELAVYSCSATCSLCED